MEGSIAEIPEEEQEALYHIGLNSLALEEYLALKDQGEIEDGGQAPTLETFAKLIERGKRYLQET